MSHSLSLALALGRSSNLGHPTTSTRGEVDCCLASSVSSEEEKECDDDEEIKGNDKSLCQSLFICLKYLHGP